MRAAWVWRGLAVLALGAPLAEALAQDPPPPPPPPRRDSTQADTLRRPVREPEGGRPVAAPAEGDTLKVPLTRADTIRMRADSIRKAQLAGLESVRQPRSISWVGEDSVMSSLTSREGYSITKYQGTNVVFKALEHTMLLLGRKAQVAKDSSVLVGDTITFNDSTQFISARGDTLVLRDPSQGQDDVVSYGRLTYDVKNKRGVVRDVTTAVESGQRWIVHGNVAAFRGDTTGAGAPAFYAQQGWLTSCEETEPHYHFAAREMKMVSKNVMVVRPAVLYIADIPVMWLPFVFNDMRPGRRSGLLSPRIGFNQIFRQSPFLRRTLEDIGYYFAINDYVSSTFTMDWRSNARGSDSDPGYVKLNSALDYVWKDRFVDGQVGMSMNFLRNGQRNAQYSVRHAQKFSERTAFTANFNYVSNTTIQRQTTFNPQLALQTISSAMNFRTGRGPFAVDLGMTQRQYPGRDQLDRDFPSLRVTSKPIEVGEWLTWTPAFSVATSQSFNIDQVGDFAFRYKQTPTGIDSTERLKRNTKNSTITFDTPVEILGFSWRNAFRLIDVANDFPERRTIYPNPRDTSVRQDRVFARTYRTGLEWETSFSLPNFSQGKLNIAPQVSIQKVDTRSPLVVRTERTGGKFVTQGLRPSVGISMSPKVYGFFPGIGPVERIRHAIEPTLQWQYTPKGNVSDEFLAANGDVAVGFLGNLPQNMLSLGFNTSFEAKLRAPDVPTRPLLADSTGDSASLGAQRPAGPEPEGRKIKLLSMNFTTLSWDFIRAREATNKQGLTNRTFDWSVRTDLLPGFDFGMNYSLFQGDPMSDTAVFKPYREGVRTNLSLDANSPIIRGLGRLLGIRMADSASRNQGQRPAGGTTPGRERTGGRGFAGSNDMMAGRSINGSARSAAAAIPRGQGWRVNLSYTGNRQRPPVGDNVKEYDPKSQCDRFADDIITQQACLNQFATGGIPSTGLPFNETTRGATLYRMPPTANINGSMSFNVTNLWSAQWQTSYDVQTKEFAQHVVQLQREMHDWDATFGFTRSPNGNFAFTFFIALRAQPDIKLDYDRPSYPRGYTGRRQF